MSWLMSVFGVDGTQQREEENDASAQDSRAGEAQAEVEEKDEALSDKKGLFRRFFSFVFCGYGKSGRKGPSDFAPNSFGHANVLSQADSRFPLSGTVGGNTEAIQRRAIRRARYFSLYITMSDGVRIAVDVALPEVANEKQVSCILHQARYNRGLKLRRPFKWTFWLFKSRLFSYVSSVDPGSGGVKLGLLSAGFGVVSMDIRGTGASGGVLTRLWSEKESEDSIEVLDWITKQNFSNGKVGLWGISYDGNAAFKTLAKGHEAIKAVAPMYMFWDIYNDIALPGGVPHHKFVGEWEVLSQGLDTGSLGKIHRLLPILFKGTAPVKKSSMSTADATSELKKNQKRHANNWSPKNELDCIRFRDDIAPAANVTADDLCPYHAVKNVWRSIDIPILLVSGFYDQTCESAISAFLATTSKGMKTRLLIGPWNHAGIQHVRLSAHQKSRLSRFDIVREIVCFFDKSMNAEPYAERPQGAHYEGNMEYSLTKRVNYFVNGEVGSRCTWKSSGNCWPPLDRVYLTFTLHPDNVLQLTITTSEEKRDFDNKDDIVKVSSRQNFQGFSRFEAMTAVDSLISYKTRNTKWFNSSKKYRTEPLGQHMEMTGNAVVDLVIGSNIGVFDVFCYIFEISANDHASYVTEGCLRSTHRGLASYTRTDDINSGKCESILLEHVSPDIRDCQHSYMRSDASPSVIHSDRVNLKLHLRSTSYCFHKNSRVLLLISGSDSKHFKTPEEAPLSREWNLYIKLFVSKLILPVVKGDDLALK